MHIPYTQLSEFALRSVIEEFITREGTDYGDQEFPLEMKVDQVKAQLKLGEVLISYDEDSQSVHLVRSNESA